MDSNFKYDEALKELEELSAKVEDPSTGIDCIGSIISRADALARDCRSYLRCAQEQLESLGE